MAIKNINTDLQIEAGLRDGDGDLGTNNQVLISTGTGINWIDGSGTGIIGGPYLPLTGGTLTGNLTISGGSDIFLADNGKTHYGASNDLEIFHNGSDSYIIEKGTGDLRLQTTNGTAIKLQFGTEDMVVALANSSVSLYHNSIKKLETTNTGVTITGELEATTLDINDNADISGIISGNFVVRSTNNSNADGANFAVDTTNKNSSEYAYEVLRSGTTVAGITTVGKITGTELEGTSLDINGNGDVSGNLTINGALTANGGITGLDNAGGISGNNYNITGVNQLTINDPGEGIVFSGTTNVQLFTIDDATDSILKVTSATALDVNAKITNLSPGSANLDAVNYQQLTDAVAGVLVYQGTWNASTNTPALASGVGTPGYYYIVSTAGSTNLDGITDWNTGDWVIFSDQATDAWQKIDHTNVLNGTGTGNQVAKWSGAGTSYTLTDGIITDNGTSVGIGTTLPGAAYKLEVNGVLKANGGYFTNPVSIFDSSATENPRLSLGRGGGEALNFDVGDRTAIIYHKQDETTGTHKLSLSVDSDSVDTNTIDFNFRNSAGTATTSTPMTILSSGRVGIGVIDPSAKLEIAADVATNVDIAHFSNSNDIAKAKISLSANSSGELSLIDGNNNTDVFITSNGNSYFNGGEVLIGTTTSTGAKLIVDHDNTKMLELKRSGNTKVRFIADSNHGQLDLYNSATVNTIRLLASGDSYLNGGNVGIGTTTPSQKLDVAGNISIYNSYAAGASLFLNHSNQYSSSIIKSIADTIDGQDSGSSMLRFYTNDNSTTSPTVALDLTSESNAIFYGKVGIGTTSPVHKFEVHGLSSGAIGFNGSNVKIGDVSSIGYQRIFPSGNSLKYSVGTEGAHQFVYGVDNSTMMHISYSGKVGIGTTTPSAILNIVNSNPKIVLEDSDNTGTFGHIRQQAGNLQLLSNNNTANGTIQFKLDNGTTTTDAMRITSSGKVGIGTTSPAHALDVVGYIRSGNTGADNTSKYSKFLGRHYTNSEEDIVAISTESTLSSNNVYIGGGFSPNNSATTIKLYTANNTTTTTGSERMRITSAGDVGIGSTVPSAKLDVRTANGNTNSLRIGRIDAGSYWDFNHAGNDLRIFNNGGTGRDILLGVNAAGTIYDNKVGIGTATPGEKLEVSGNIKLNSGALIISGTPAGQGAQTKYISGVATTNDLWLNVPTNGRYRFAVADSQIVEITSAGNVGIGTTNPTSKLTISSNIAGDGSWDDSGILISNTATGATGESALVFKNAGPTGTGTSYWFTGLNQSTEYRLAYGTSFSNANSRLTLGSGGVLTLNTYGTGARTGTAAYNLSVDSSGNVIESTIGGVAPVTPGSITSTIVGQTIEIAFNESTTANIDYYQVWSSDDGGDYGIIAQIPPTDFSATMTVVDTSFSTGGTMSYRVYAVKSGVYSSPGTTSKTYTVGTLDVTDMTVINLNTAYYIQYEKPASRFIDHIEIYMDSQTTQGALNRSNASIVYSGQNTSFMKSVGVSNNFHQFWVEVVTT